MKPRQKDSQSRHNTKESGHCKSALFSVCMEYRAAICKHYLSWLNISCLNNIAAVLRACIFASIILICFADSIKKSVEIILAVYAAEKRIADYVSVFIDHICGRERHYSE